MAKTTEISVRCLNCNEWFPSPIGVSDSETFDETEIFGNRVQCPFCKEITACNKDNFRVRFEDGGFFGDNT